MLPIRKKLPAFTLIELLVVLILSAIVTAMVLSIYSSMTGYYLSLERKADDAKNINLLLNTLRMDFETCSTVTILENHSLVCVWQGGKKVTYELAPDVIYRRQMARQDSIRCRRDSLIFKFKGQPKVDGIIDQLRVDVSYKGKNLKLTVVKKYDAASLLLKSDSSEWTKY